MKKFLNRMLTILLTASMVIGLVSEVSVAKETNDEIMTEEIVSDSDYVTDEAMNYYDVRRDDKGNPINLGGMEIVIRDWRNVNKRNDESTPYKKAREAYWQWLEKNYNFKVTYSNYDYYGSIENDMVSYVRRGGTADNYIFVQHSYDSILANNAAYDLTKLSCVDFNADKFTSHPVQNLTNYYGMNGEVMEPAIGVIFNRYLLENRGINPDSIYEMQRNGTWTWEAFENLLNRAQIDTDNDGVIDVWGLTCQESNMTKMAVLSNNSSFVGQTASGLVNNLENANTLQALQYCVNVYSKYDSYVDGSTWDYYREEFKSGGAAFCVDYAWALEKNSHFGRTNDSLGFVAFPKGPNASTYTTQCDSYAYMIPSCYSYDKAWKIAFAYDLWTEPVPGYENYNPYQDNEYNIDSKAISETFPLLSGLSSQAKVATDLGPMTVSNFNNFIWSIEGKNTNTELLNSSIEYYRSSWNSDVATKSSQYANRLPKYTITYNVNGHGSAIAPRTVLAGAAAPTVYPIDSKYYFGGWYKDAACTVKYDNKTERVTSDITLYAKWNLIEIYTIKLKKTSYVYTGKAICPTVTVKDAAGKTVSKKKYNVTYSKNKNYGTATVKVTFLKSFTKKGPITAKFDIVPSPVKITKANSPAKKQLYAWWNATTSKGCRYEVITGIGKDFKDSYTYQLSTPGILFKPLKSKKTYYVKVRVIKTVKGKNYYSEWSKAKAVKVK